MHDKNKKNKIIPDEKMILRSKNFWVWDLEWERKVWGGEETKTVKRDQGEMNKNCAITIYRQLSRSCWEAIEIESQESRWIEIAITAIEKRSLSDSIDSVAVERYQEAVEIA